MKNKILSKISQIFRWRKSCPTQGKTSLNAKEVSKSQNFERCVMCDALTTVQISTPIDLRDNYEIGLGQLCPTCALKHLKLNEKRNSPSNVQILIAVEQSIKDTKEELENK